MTLLWQDARRKAQETLDNYWDHSYPVKIVSICKAMGVTPSPGELPEGGSGMIVKEHSSEPRAYTERTEPQTRRRFTLAHELGHFVERVTIAQDNDFAFMDKRSDDYDIHEFYADEFAGALLMPEHDFIQKVKNDGMIAAAAYFGVSLAAVRKRMERLRKHGADI